MTVFEEIPTFDPSEIRTPIQEFYSGQNVFITGGTGFLGKILIEKLLRSCSDLTSLYLLVRSKKGKNVHSRIDDIFDDPIFDRLRKEVPKFRHRVFTVTGDCSFPGLGLSSSDKDLLMREVSIVFNVAATVRFDEKLKQAVAINVSGTKELLELCKSMEKLKAVVHVSTAYSNCNRRDIDEKFYEPPITGDNAIKLVQSLNDDKLDAITPILLGDFPNTYTFTKVIAEQVVQQYGKELPVGIFRPSIVLSSYLEPVEGWIDNIYGPTGVLVASGTGLIRAWKMDDNCTAELVPVDLTVNALIACAWDIAHSKNEDANPPIYNYVAAWNKSLTWGKYVQLAFETGKHVPSMRSVWCYSVTTTKSNFLFFILSFFLHTLPAFIIDLGLFIAGQKPRLMKIYRKISKYSSILVYFSTNEWTFGINNTRTLWNKLSKEDKKIFYFSMEDFDWEDYMKKCIDGIRIYIFKDDPSTIPAARKRMAKILILHKLIKLAAVALGCWLLYLMISLIFSFASFQGFMSLDENLIVR
ncbi:fatty acyl-CoA reductase wat-like [Orussus abietinus]|uniref:fatty acyl-CoA reductase wat-like n=1 Tax=Orussus abietinus TaxID=222816 RepID=UPI0006268361|nr:fatty acyl-CoA reductase wat-like [Orussus abietinus]